MTRQNRTNDLPEVLREFAAKYPKVWEAYDRLSEAASDAGPLDERTVRLVKLAVAIGSGREGAVHSHAKRALKAGLTSEELVHVAILAITSIGWSGAFAAITWINDVLPS